MFKNLRLWANIMLGYGFSLALVVTGMLASELNMLIPIGVIIGAPFFGWLPDRFALNKSRVLSCSWAKCIFSTTRYKCIRHIQCFIHHFIFIRDSVSTIFLAVCDKCDRVHPILAVCYHRIFLVRNLSVTKIPIPVRHDTVGIGAFIDKSHGHT